MVEFLNDWDGLLADELQKPYFQNILAFLNKEYRRTQCYPPPQQVFRALRATPYGKVRAVILGQDPYHGPGQAHGLCFSVNAGVPLPPSLENIFAELHADLGCPAPQSGDLSGWAEQGVLLLNTILTVQRGRPMSHAGIGWQTFTDRVIELLNAREKPIRVPALGLACARKKNAAHQSRAPDPRSAAPKPAFGWPRLFWLPALLQGQRLPSGARRNADRLAATVKKHFSCLFRLHVSYC